MKKSINVYHYITNETWKYYLESVDMLIDWYSFKSNTRFKRCPLCTNSEIIRNEYIELFNIYDEYISTCIFCPFQIFLDLTCDEYFKSFDFKNKSCILKARDSRDDEWCKISLNRLNLWRTIITNRIIWG